MKILNYGSLNIDRVYTVENFVRPGETVSSRKFELFPGGKGLNQSVSIAKSGVDVYHAGKIGPDGNLLLGTLNEAGVHTDFVSTNGSSTGHAVIQVNKYGNNCILLHGGANLEITTSEIDSVLNNFTAGDILLLQNEINNIPYIVDRAFEKYMRIVINPSPMDSTIKDLDFQKVTYLILNEVEGADLTGETEPSKIIDYLLELYPQLKVVLTLGRIGSMYGDAHCRLQQGAYPVNAVDTTGAGDTYLGYFISRIADGSPIWSALRIAAQASAVAVTRRGAAISIPDRGEVYKFAAERGEKKKAGPY
jgi:ribokinase